MAGQVPNDIRDKIISLFREKVAEKMEICPFLHQRQVWCATDGMELTGQEDPYGVTVRLEDGSITRVGITERAAGRARFVADLGAFKIGKSFGAALWGSGFAAVPGAKVSLVGLEYNICEPEFSYLAEFLLSGRGLGLKAKSFVNRPRQGDMYMELENGAVFECRSWERKESLKGKENDAYIYCEAYQLPGIECFTSFSQNLRARRGYAYFATTPDRPWIKQLHEMGHGFDPEWHCTCSVGAESNPFTFDGKSKERDKLLMTREKYEIHYNGQMGDFVGRVFSFSRGDCVFTAGTHPHLFSGGDRAEHLRIPANWTILGGSDTGTNYSAILAAFDPNGNAYVLDEFPNYRYVGGYIERDEQLSIPQWAQIVKSRCRQLNANSVFWADPNTQFKGEFRNYGIHLLAAKGHPEQRTEVTREYFQHKRIYLAPWVTVLPFELENAAWPEEASASGKFGRIKDRDHTLDCLEHVLARRPLGRIAADDVKKGSWAAGAGLKRKNSGGNIHLGRF